MTRLALRLFFLGSCAAGCNLAVSLDELQDGAGGMSSTGPGSSGTLNTSSQTSTQTGATNTTSTQGVGGSAPTYADCVASWNPLAHFSLSGQSLSEPNLGSWPGDGSYATPYSSAPAVLPGGDGATSFGAGGKFTFQRPAFFGGFQAFSVELWFSVPADYNEPVFQASEGVAGLFLSVEKRFDPGGLDFVRFRFRDAVGAERLVTHFADLSEPMAPHHVVAVYRQDANTMFGGGGEADDLLLFLDGVPSPNNATGAVITMPALGGPLEFGNGFAGRLDEVLVYPHAMSAESALEHYELGIGIGSACAPPP